MYLLIFLETLDLLTFISLLYYNMLETTSFILLVEKPKRFESYSRFLQLN